MAAAVVVGAAVVVAAAVVVGAAVVVAAAVVVGAAVVVAAAVVEGGVDSLVVAESVSDGVVGVLVGGATAGTSSVADGGTV